MHDIFKKQLSTFEKALEQKSYIHPTIALVWEEEVERGEFIFFKFPGLRNSAIFAVTHRSICATVLRCYNITEWGVDLCFFQLSIIFNHSVLAGLVLTYHSLLLTAYF